MLITEEGTDGNQGTTRQDEKRAFHGIDRTDEHRDITGDEQKT
jgi:hypothetical protein